MENIHEAIKDPYLDVDISLLVSSKSYKDFLKLYNNLLLSSHSMKCVEMLVKIDDSDERYLRLLKYLYKTSQKEFSNAHISSLLP